jgi:hypothetical protein
MQWEFKCSFPVRVWGFLYIGQYSIGDYFLVLGLNTDVSDLEKNYFYLCNYRFSC